VAAAHQVFIVAETGPSLFIDTVGYGKERQTIRTPETGTVERQCKKFVAHFDHSPC
jgi:hypothetical protein